ncbi:MAG: OmpW/AlkL family protein [Psychroflexus halocasei]
MKKLVFTFFIALLAIPSVLLAQENDNNSEDFSRWQVRVRGVAVIPDPSATIEAIGGDVDISDSFIPELDFTYFFTENLAVELILGTTKHEVHTVGSDLSPIGGGIADVDLGEVWLLPPTLNLQYHREVFENFKPYIGAGVNYTIFYDADDFTTVKSVSYDNAFGISTQIGFDYMFTDKFFFNVDFKYIFLKADVEVDASNLADNLSIPAEVEINPMLLGFGVGMKF